MKRFALWFGFFAALAFVFAGVVPVAGQAGQDGVPQSSGSVDGGRSIQDQVAKLVSDDGAYGDGFGAALSVDGDVAVIGALRAHVGGHADQGAAYVFYRDQGGPGAWGQVAKLTAADGAANDAFGYSVAVRGDTVIVGAYMADAGHTNQGAAYIFYRNQGGPDAWGQVAKLTTTDPGFEVRFGTSASVDGDTAVVGADGAGEGAMGAAYVYYRNQGGADAWGLVAKLVSVGGWPMDYFGGAVAVDGDTIIVGAEGVSSGPWEAMGAVYFFYRNRGGPDAWGQVAMHLGPSGDYTGYGGTVSLSGDTAVVGEKDQLYGTMGMAFVYYRDQGGPDAWGGVATLYAGWDDAYYYGWSVSVEGDSIIVGAPDTNVGPNECQGTAYVYLRNQGGPDSWGLAERLVSDDGAPWDGFGASVAVSGSAALSGAPGAAVGGAAYVFALPAAPLLHLNRIRLTARPGTQPGTYVVKAVSFVHNEDHAAAPGVTVRAEWTLPSGRHALKTALSNLKGQARFSLHVQLVGTYQFCVTDLVKTGYGYDPGANEVPACQSLMVGP